MKNKVIYSPQEWNAVSALPKEFFYQYATMIKGSDRLTKIHMMRVLVENHRVENPFDQESAFKLHDGSIDGLIYTYVMQNQHLFIKET